MLNIVNVFVYGTLKPGEANYQRYCAGKVIGVQKAIAFGQLFALPMGYPAMTLGNKAVYGFLLSFPNSAILADLDHLEDYQPHRPATENEYNRQAIEIYNLAFTNVETAWTYLMTPEQIQFYHGVLVPNGWWSGCG